MCNHYRLDARDIQMFKDWEDIGLPPVHLDMQTDVWPKRPGLVARIECGAKMLDVMNWGVPTTVPGKRPGSKLTKHVTNVRNLTSPFWKSMLANPDRRCLVPFNRFAEPKPGKDPETGRPAEYWFTVNYAPVSAFAGIWRPSEAGNVFAFLTCEPNPLVAPLHPKAMPVILHPQDYDRWLIGSLDEACALATPLPSQLMTVS
jgi:putative SOS response-associated peptidase YedK